MAIVVDVKHGSVFQTYASRSLHLDGEGVHLIPDPADLEMLAIKDAIEDIAPI